MLTQSIAGTTIVVLTIGGMIAARAVRDRMVTRAIKDTRIAGGEMIVEIIGRTMGGTQMISNSQIIGAIAE
jgi:hypothetical protein